MKTTRTSTITQDTAPRRRGRPSRTERREALIETYGKDKVKSLDGECGQPCENLTTEQFDELYKHVAGEKGWGTSGPRPAF